MLSNMEVALTTIAKAAFSIAPATETRFDALKTITMFCAAGLIISVLLASYGVDLGSGLF
jgi:hypothetical protein